jgi:hypothetical protein
VACGPQIFSGFRGRAVRRPREHEALIEITDANKRKPKSEERCDTIEIGKRGHVDQKQEMQANGAICQTVLPGLPPPKPPTLCPARDLIDSAAAKIKRQRLLDNCMRFRGWEVAR